jgi:hypothetical protein
MYSSNTQNYRPERTDIKVFTEDKLGNPHYSSRLYKILSHIYDPQEWSVYVDADIFIPEQKLIDEVKASGKDIGVFKHPERDCVYKEADEILARGKDTRENLKSHIEHLKSIGWPEHAGLAACGVIVRHHTEEIKRLNEKWWIEICTHSKRDQLSFPYIFRDVHYFEGNIYDYKKWG